MKKTYQTSKKRAKPLLILWKRKHQWVRVRLWSFIGGIFCTFICIVQLGYVVTKDHLLPVTGSMEAPTIFIDAGHGGEDGGTVGISGEIESHINLSIALKLEQILLLYGIEPILLRQDDRSLHLDSATTLRDKKKSDLAQRVALVNESSNAILMSIHQNSYSQEQYHGAQVFYTPEAEELATSLQSLLSVGLDPDNQRTSKPVDSSLYLFQHIQVPGVLVECGFLSNYSEASALASPHYQQRIACILGTSLLETQLTIGNL